MENFLISDLKAYSTYLYTYYGRKVFYAGIRWPFIIYRNWWVYRTSLYLFNTVGYTGKGNVYTVYMYVYIHHVLWMVNDLLKHAIQFRAHELNLGQDFLRNRQNIFIWQVRREQNVIKKSYFCVVKILTLYTHKHMYIHVVKLPYTCFNMSCNNNPTHE